MANQVVRTESTGWFSRIVSAIKGVLVGLLLFVASFPLLFWNEGRAVRRAQDLEEGRGAVIEATADAVRPADEGKLVHLSGPATTTDALADAELGPAAPGALRLRRTVEMYQWKETKETRTEKNLGGSEQRTTRYTYALAWSAEPIDASRFEEPTGHQNPPMPVVSQTFDAARVTVGARTLTADLVSQHNGFEALPVEPAQAPGLSRFGRPVARAAEGLFVGASSATPQLGDLRVTWERVPAGAVSVLAAQRGATFAEWRTPSGRVLEQNLDAGTVTADGMIQSLELGNVFFTWLLRFAGWLAMFIGLVLIFKPLVVVADVVPFIGSLVGAGAGFVAFVISAPLSLLTIALGWVFYRPLVGIALLVLGGGLAFVVGRLAVTRGRAKNAERQAARAAA
jgi:hypothetical protein